MCKTTGPNTRCKGTYKWSEIVLHRIERNKAGEIIEVQKRLKNIKSKEMRLRNETN